MKAINKKITLVKDKFIHNINDRVGKLASSRVLSYTFSNHFKEWRVVDYVYLQDNDEGMACCLPLGELFASLPYHGQEKLAKKVLFKFKNKADATKKVNELMKKYRATA